MLALDVFAGAQGAGILDGLKLFLLRLKFKEEASIPLDEEGRPIPIEGVNVASSPQILVDGDPYTVRVMPQRAAAPEVACT